MIRSIYRLGVAAAAAVILAAGCAGTEEARQRTQQKEEQIADILSQPLEADDYVESKRCLAPQEFRDVDILDNQRILFKGRGDQYWLNTLRMRCPDLNRGTVLRVESVSALGQICDMDSFQVGDWFDGPWYRNALWPWYGRTGIHCTLGRFQPVTPAQADAIKAALRAR